LLTISNQIPYKLNSFVQTGINNNEIEYYLSSLNSVYIYNGDIDSHFIRVPGFVSDDKKIVDYYSKIVYNILIETNVATPPRGNISTQCKVIICGIKPGCLLEDMKFPEAAWLFGPSAKMLNKMLLDLNVYPYFTNVFHDRKADETDINSLNQIIREIKFMKCLNSNIKIIFLGKYQIFDTLISDLCYDFNIKAIKIWHPSYLCRAYTDAKFNKWKKTVEYFLTN
jgi:hypothetical protein